MIAFDTNILVYACDEADRERQLKAVDLILGASDAILLWQVAVEFIAACRKIQRPGFGSEQAWAELFSLLKVFLVFPDRSILGRAQTLHLDSRISYWDSLLIAACLETGVKRLYSEDLPGRNIEDLEIINPFA